MENAADQKQIMVLGVGNILFSDEGVGVRVVEALTERYAFPPTVSVVDGGTLGIHLLGTISKADFLIVVDAIRNGGVPGALYRLTGEQIPQRIRAKNSLHQVDLLEALTLSQALDKVPETVILGVEPQDIETLALDLTEPVRDRMEDLILMVLHELKRLGIRYSPRESDISCASPFLPRS